MKKLFLSIFHKIQSRVLHLRCRLDNQEFFRFGSGPIRVSREEFFAMGLSRHKL